MIDPDATHYAAPARNCTGCGLHRDGRHAVTRDPTRVDCPECQDALALLVERRLRGPPPIGEPSYAGAQATLREVERVAAAVAPWAVEVRAGARHGRVPSVLVVTLGVVEDLEYYRDYAHLVAKRLNYVLPAGVELRVEIELAREISTA